MLVDDLFYHDKYGDFKVISYESCNDVTIIFLNTGYIYRTTARYARNLKVFDPMVPSVCGVGFVGGSLYKSTKNGVKTKMYQTWHNMLIRSYCAAYQVKHPTYKDCYVCSEWLNYQRFAKWYILNYPTNDGVYHLDKDILISGNKVYSPATCIFVRPSCNFEKAHAKSYTFKSPKSDVVKIYNLKKFCIDNRLDSPSMIKVNSGQRKTHKGWLSY